MALIECPECGKDLSSTAPTCPHCGYKQNVEEIVNVQTTQGSTGKFADPATNMRSCMQIIAFLFIGGVIFLIIALIMGNT